jgi:hypothetical protein
MTLALLLLNLRCWPAVNLIIRANRDLYTSAAIPANRLMALFLPGRAGAGIENLVQVAEFGSSRQL